GNPATLRGWLLLARLNGAGGAGGDTRNGGSMQKRSSRRRVAALAGILALLGTACSGGTSDKAATRAHSANAQVPAPGSAGPAPAELNRTEAASATSAGTIPAT